MPNARSDSSSTPDSVIAGSANTIMNDMARIAQMNSGMRLNDMPGARRRKIVTMKLMPPTVVEMPRNVMPRAQKSMLRPGEYSDDVSGTYANQPPSGGWPTTKLA